MNKERFTVENTTRVGARIRALSSRISTLSRLINLESKRPLPDQLKLSEYKRQKLKLKDDIRHILTARVRRELQTFYVPAKIQEQQRV